MELLDDLGSPVTLERPPRRVVSLVPSLTESVAALDESLLVGATQWCTHPAGLAVERVRGTKNPDLAAIAALEPDLVLANREENRKVDVERLRAQGIEVWVTVIETVDQALSSLARLFTEALAAHEPDWLEQARAEWTPEFEGERLRVAIPVWRDPWIVVGSDTFTGDLAHRLGLDNVFADSTERYPHTNPEEIVAAGAELMVLPDEPYVFTAEDGPEAFPSLPSALLSGRLLTWYGPSMEGARQTLRDAIKA